MGSERVVCRAVVCRASLTATDELVPPPRRVQPQTSVPWRRMISPVMGFSEDPSGKSHHTSIYLPHSSELTGLYCLVSEIALVALQGQFLHRHSRDQRLHSVTLTLKKSYFPYFFKFLKLILNLVSCSFLSRNAVFKLADVFRTWEKLVFMQDDTYLPLSMLFLLEPSYMSE